jgi:DNA-binding CsgD family transcriptional regulator
MARRKRSANSSSKTAPDDADLISLVEAIYRVDYDPEGWLTNILEAAQPLMDQGLGLCAGTYDASTPQLAVEAFVNFANPPGSSDRVTATSHEFTPEFVEAAFLGHVCGIGSEVAGWNDLPFVRENALGAWGIRDRIGINGLSNDCSGTILGIHLPEQRSLTQAERRCYAKIAGHLGAAHRLRRRLRAGIAQADAVIGPGGRVEHAEGRAKEKAALLQLSEAGRAIGAARSRNGRQHPEAALAKWPAMVSTRWTLVDLFDHDGRQYLLARQNDPATPGPDLLTKRERQVVSYALMGHHNKLIAYELGISASTVRVLLHRSAQKLGVRTREEVVALARHTLRLLRAAGAATAGSGD